MELTIEQALQQGVAAHKEGKLQDAERLYRAILQSQPLHPDANHNLGVLAVSVNKADAALPLFKTALEANPKIEQFWLSYIDALIKEQQFENAKQVFEQAKTQGMAEEKLNALEERLALIVQAPKSTLSEQKNSLTFSEKRKKLAEQKTRKKTTKQNLKANNPSQQQLGSLLEHYQNGRLSDAEKLATSISHEFPSHNFSWKILGAVFKATGRKSEAINANQKSVSLAPKDTEAHYNLGNTLKELGRLDEAVASYRQAIVLKSDFAEAHSNLGSTLQELGRLEEAEASYRQAIAFKPDYADAHNNFGVILQKLGRLDEAEASYKQAIAVKPDYPSAKDMLAALIGETSATAPRDYVEGLFDNYAAKFESSLVGNLEYKIPKLIVEMILKNNPGGILGSILDLGCGTGLTGLEIKKYCTNLEGIDLSKRMLDEARKKNVYDRLTYRDIIDYLLTENLHFDYFISTDVFIYVGDLSNVFKLIKSQNSSGGKLVFSTEHTDKDDFCLEKSGRYSHSKTYIESLCEKFNYTLAHFEIVDLRKEKTGYLTGGLYLLDF
jgi:predicted TPR repeat methyltransferase